MIVIIVHMTVKPGTEEECVRLCREMAEASRKESGCLQYVVQRSRQDPRHFAIYEQYVDQAALDAHGASPHFARYITGGVDALIESRTLEFFVPLS